MKPPVRLVLTNLAVAIAYLALGKIGLSLALPPGYVSAIWPAAGLALAVVWIWGAMPTVLGIALGSLLTNWSTSGSVQPDLLGAIIAGGSALQAWLAGAWLRRDNPKIEFDTTLRVRRFGLVLAVACLVAPVVGNMGLLGRGVISASQLPQSFLTWWLGDALGALIFAPVSLMVIAPDISWRQRRWSVGLPLLAAFACCGVIYAMVRETGERQLMRNFAAAADPLMHEMRALDRIHGQALRQFAAHYRSADILPGAEFTHTANEVQQTLPGLRAISWAPLLDADRRSAFPDMARAAGSAARTIVYPPGFTPGQDGLAAPITQIWPEKGNEKALGVDLLGEPTRRQTVLRAMATGKLSMSSVIKLTQDPTGPGGVLLMMPMVTSKGKGVISAVLDLRGIEASITQLVPGAAWELREIQATDELPMWSSVAGGLPRFSGETLIDHQGVYLQQVITVADRTWRLTLHMPHGSNKGGADNAALLVLFLAFLTCGMFVCFLLLMHGERERIAAEVDAKTLALREEIKERERVEMAHANSERLLADVIENSGLIIFVKDIDGIYRLGNRMWEDSNGWRREDTLGKDDFALFPAEVAQSFRDHDRVVIESGKVMQYEESFVQDGALHFFLATKFPLFDANGKASGICGMTTDITNLKKNEAELEKARDAAESANVAKSQFLATMSHELRTPMNGILGMAQLLMMDGIDDGERKEYVQTILASGKTLLTILNDILDLSKIEAGKLELNRDAFDPATLLDETAAVFREVAQGKGLEIVVSAPRDGQCYLGDPIRLRQMLSNYLGNAIKFSEQGSIGLCVDVPMTNGDGSTLLVFSVSDQGMGIPAEKIAQLFTPFVQVDGSATRRFGGTGLGLSIVQRLARQMGGEVGVTSREDEGSRFWFSVAAEPAGERSLVRENWTPPTKKGGNDMRARAETEQDRVWVLVAEDNKTNQLVVSAMLEQLGVAVRCVNNGAEAVALLAEPGIDMPRLVLMDCQMPVMDGFAATAAIRQDEANRGLPRLPVVALTAGAFEEDRQRCREAGMDDFLTKPLAFDQLVASLQQVGVPVN